MSRENKKIVFFIIFLSFVVLIVLFAKMTIFTPTITPESEERKVAGLIIQFRDGVSEQEAKDIFGNYNLTRYKIDYNVYDMPDNYYIIIDKDKIMDVRDELRNENWTESTPAIEKGNYYIITKGNYYIITISEQAINDKNFLSILEKYNLQVKKFVYCHIHFSEHSLSGISEKHANNLKSELEMNENVFTVYFESIEE
ncbi:UPF0228 family protein [Methanosarcina hadiensis]|uniref:UPF0228 family protein n=1 Tax=Methanosarcina hadiensis TaxID=3078083 RepID=UPI00397740AF